MSPALVIPQLEIALKLGRALVTAAVGLIIVKQTCQPCSSTNELINQEKKRYEKGEEKGTEQRERRKEKRGGRTGKRIGK